jgi:hypothetical protein
MADHFGTTAVRTTALNNLQTQLNAGLNFATVEGRVSSTYWPEMYTTRRQSGVHQGWMFLNMSPEIGRYLAANVASATLARNASGKTKYPLWWMGRANYSGRWTGDEGIGIPTEMMGMVMPVERWVAQTAASTLRDYMRSGPTGIGDSYWLESLVQAIEATGSLVWTDVRSGTPGCNYSVSAPSFSVPSGASTQTESVTSTAGCTWTASSNAGWITVSPATGTGSGTVTLTIAANTGTARAGTASIAGQTVTVNQAAGSGGTAPAPPTNLRVQ